MCKYMGQQSGVSLSFSLSSQFKKRSMWSTHTRVPCCSVYHLSSLRPSLCAPHLIGVRLKERIGRRGCYKLSHIYLSLPVVDRRSFERPCLVLPKRNKSGTWSLKNILSPRLLSKRMAFSGTGSVRSAEGARLSPALLPAACVYAASALRALPTAEDFS